MRTEVSDSVVTIRVYTPGIEQSVFEAAHESIREIEPLMRTWRQGASLAIATQHVAETIAAWRAGQWYDFVITRADSPDYLGRVGLDQLRPGLSANMGYWVRTSQTRQGLATAAVRLVVQLGFEDLGLQRLDLSTSADNLASQRVAEKAGATLEHAGIDGYRYAFTRPIPAAGS